MSEFNENFMEPMEYYAPPSSPNTRTTLAMLNHSDNDLNSIAEMFPQTDFSRDHTEQRSGLGQRLAARIGFNLSPIETKNINSHFSAIFRNTTVLSPVLVISPGFSPSAMLQSPKIISSSPITHNGPPKMVENSGESYATKITFDNELYRQQLHVDQSLQEGNIVVRVSNLPMFSTFSKHSHHIFITCATCFDAIPTKESICISSPESHGDPTDPLLAASFESEVIDEINIISMEEESESEFEDENLEEDDAKDEEDGDFFDKLDVNPSNPKRRKFEVPNMTGATNTQQRIIIQMECEENNPDDGFRWRKYGQKFVKGNPNPRSYYKCNMYGCDVKKRVERGAYNSEILVIAYDGIHEHATPISRCSHFVPHDRFGSSSFSQNDTNQTDQLGKTLPPSFTSSLEETSSFPSLGLQIDMVKFYKIGLSKLPSIPINLDSDFLYRTK